MSTPSAQRAANARQRRLDRGLCKTSGLHGAHVPGKTMCQECLDRHRLASKRARSKIEIGKEEIRVADDVGWGQWRKRMTAPVPYTPQGARCDTSSPTRTVDEEPQQLLLFVA